MERQGGLWVSGCVLMSFTFEPNTRPLTLSVVPNVIQRTDQSWYFNSSIAEQMNVWLGDYHAIV